jgi:hypothetical protein
LRTNAAVRPLISPHTLSDHFKAVLATARVSGRGELVARLFTVRYWARAAGADPS